MPVRPSAPLLRKPFADAITTGLPANALRAVAARSRTEMTGVACARPGTAKPAAAAAPAPRKSRRVRDDTKAPGLGWTAVKYPGCGRRSSLELARVAALAVTASH